MLILKFTDDRWAYRVGIDWSMASAAIGFAALATLAFGLAPAFAAVRGAPRTLRLRKILVGAQVAAGCVLVIVAALLGRGVQRLMTAEFGVDPTHIVILDPDLQSHGIKAKAAMETLRDLESRLRSVPGVESVTAASLFPFGSRMIGAGISNPPVMLALNEVQPDYFSTLGIRLLAGRTFQSGEKGAAMVSESAARRIWPGESPLGKKIRESTVVGVVSDTQWTRNNNHDNHLELYQPLSENWAPNSLIAVRVVGDPAERVAHLMAAVHVAPLNPSATLMRTQVRDRLQESALGSGVIAGLGAIALMLAAVGVFGLISYSVVQRTREIGIRMALGAGRGDVLRAVLNHYRAPLVLGTVVGTAAALAVSRMLASVVAGMEPNDALGHSAGLAVFLAVALSAALIPARRALKVDPSTALRWE